MLNRNVRIGIVGTGFARSVQIPGFKHAPGCEIVAVVSKQLERAQACAREFEIPYAYDDYRDMLAAAKPDLVVISTPVFLHHPIALAALNTGCHVLCEKPMAMNVAEARDMVDRAAVVGTNTVIDHQLRFDPMRLRVKQLIEEGFIGKVYHIQINIVEAERPDRMRPTYDWWSEASHGGGALGAIASHMIDLVQWWLGDIGAVSAQLGTWVRERHANDTNSLLPVTSDDQFTLLAETCNGSLFVLFYSAVSRHLTSDRIEIIGADGTLVLDSLEGLWGARMGEQLVNMSIVNPNSYLPHVKPGVWAASFVGLAREIVGAIREERRPEHVATFESGLRVQEILAAARRSWSEHRWIDVSPR